MQQEDKTLPVWMSDPMLLIGFSVAIGVENRLHLLGDTFEDKDAKSIEEILKKALILLNDSLSAILEY